MPERRARSAVSVWRRLHWPLSRPLSPTCFLERLHFPRRLPPFPLKLLLVSRIHHHVPLPSDTFIRFSHAFVPSSFPCPAVASLHLALPVVAHPLTPSFCTFCLPALTVPPRALANSLSSLIVFKEGGGGGEKRVHEKEKARR